MNTFELQIWDDERNLCTFYTVLCDGEEENVTDKFFEKFENDVEFEDAVQDLLAFVLIAIGDDNGAVDELFNRYENEVTGLPSHGRVKLGEFVYHYPGFPLRLYALKINKEIVVLFGGGIKDGTTNQNSSLKMQWKEACLFAKRITEALGSEEILIDEVHRRLTNHLGGNEIIL